jgi:hypothetical protein
VVFREWVALCLWLGQQTISLRERELGDEAAGGGEEDVDEEEQNLSSSLEDLRGLPLCIQLRWEGGVEGCV